MSMGPKVVDRSIIYCPDGSKIETDFDWKDLSELVKEKFGREVSVSDGCYRVEYWLKNSKEKWFFDFVVSHGSVAAHKRQNNLSFYFSTPGKTISNITTLEEAERYLKLQAFL